MLRHCSSSLAYYRLPWPPLLGAVSELLGVLSPRGQPASPAAVVSSVLKGHRGYFAVQRLLLPRVQVGRRDARVHVERPSPDAVRLAPTWPTHGIVLSSCCLPASTMPTLFQSSCCSKPPHSAEAAISGHFRCCCGRLHVQAEMPAATVNAEAIESSVSWADRASCWEQVCSCAGAFGAAAFTQLGGACRVRRGALLEVGPPSPRLGQ